MEETRILMMAERYKLWLNGNAYIAAQELGLYEAAYEMVYGDRLACGTIIAIL